MSNKKQETSFEQTSAQAVEKATPKAVSTEPSKKRSTASRKAETGKSTDKGSDKKTGKKSAAVKSESKPSATSAAALPSSTTGVADSAELPPLEAYDFPLPEQHELHSKEEDEQACAEFIKRSHEAKARFVFLLDYIPRDSMAGLELSVFRRIGLFQRFLGTDNILLLTRNYQSRGVENAAMQIDLERFDKAQVLNLYDYLQGINRAAPMEPAPEPAINTHWHARPAAAEPKDTQVYDEQNHCVMYIRRYPSGQGVDYINFLLHDKIYRRDTYDMQGFLSRTEFIEPKTGFTYSEVYYRSDHTVAFTVTNRPDGPDGKRRKTVAVELMDRQGHVMRRFTGHDELVGWWLVQIFKGKTNTFNLIIADEINNYQLAFKELNRHREDCNNLKVICVAHSGHLMDPTNPNSKLGDNYRYVYELDQRVDMLVTFTAWQKHDIDVRFRGRAHPVTVIPHPLPGEVPQQVPPRRQELPPHSLIMVARLDQLKRHEHAMLALKKIIEAVPDTTLHFFGVGPHEQHCRDFAKEQGLESKVFFHGFVTDMDRIYDSASILLSCSKVEGFGLTLLEALIRGCPVVSYNVRYGAQAMIEDGVNGYLVSNANHDALAERCIRILQDDQLRRRLAEGAVKSTDRFAQSRIAAMWARLLTSQLPQG